MNRPIQPDEVVMLDTVVLRIPPNKYKIRDHSRFKPPTWGLLDPFSYRKFVNNRTALEKKNGIYRPKLTINKMGRNAPMDVEFSAPKIIFAENVSELVLADFTKEVRDLCEDIWHMGVDVPEEYLPEASIVAFHPSRNISLTRGYTVSFAIKELSKIDLSYRFDMDEKKYRNGGHVLQYYSKIHSLLFYDKVRDDRLPEKRAIDKDKTLRQQEMFAKTEKDVYLEILKMEVRLRKRKMVSLLPALSYPADPNFKDIFNPNLCRKILKLYWEGMVIEKNAFLFSLNANPLRILQQMIKSNRMMKPKDALYLTALKILCKDAGVRELRSTLGFIGSERTWERIHADIGLLNNYETRLDLHGFIRDIEKSLENTKPFKLISVPISKN